MVCNLAAAANEPVHVHALQPMLKHHHGVRHWDFAVITKISSCVCLQVPTTPANNKGDPQPGDLRTDTVRAWCGNAKLWV
jgi:hypothetical protein